MSNYKYTFFDNQLIGVDELNQITSRLVSGGISAIYSGADFNVYDINNSNFAILSGGVVPESDSNLKVVSLSGGKYLINQGLCFFNDGTSMEVLKGGEEIIVPLGEAKYIYLVSDKNQMKCYVEIADNKKQTGVYQLLAQIDETGIITDRRTYARGKLPGLYSSNEGKNVNLTFEYNYGDFDGVDTLEIPVGDGTFSHLCIETKTGKGSIFYCQFQDGVVVNHSATINSFALFEDDKVGEAIASVNIKIESGKLIIPLQRAHVNKNRSATVSYHLW